MKKIIGIIFATLFAVTLFINGTILNIDANANANVIACSQPAAFDIGKYVTVESLCTNDDDEFCGIKRQCVFDSRLSTNVPCTDLVCV